MWLHLPTSAYSPAPEGSTLPSGSLCQALAVSATWRTKSLPEKSWRLALRKAPLTTRLSGLTCEPSRADSIVAGWLESLADSPAPISPSPESRLALRETRADSGLNMLDSFARFNPDGSLSKTSPQCSLWETDEPYSENLPTWGSMRSGVLYRRPTWEPAISESESSSWLTPHGMSGMDHTGKVGAGGEFAASVERIAGTANWPSPRSEDAESCGNHPDATDSLTGAAGMWSTPKAITGGANSKRENRPETGGVDLQEQVSTWNTPTVSDAHKSDDGPKSMARRQSGEMLTSDQRLVNQAAAWATPSARDWNSGEASQETLDKNSLPLNEQALLFQSSPPAPKQSPGMICWCGTHGCGLPSHKRKLNPLFVEWLQGLPLNWTSKTGRTDSEVLETWFARCRERLRSLCLRGGLD